MREIFWTDAGIKPSMEIPGHRCTPCDLREHCLPMGMDESETRQIDKLVRHRHNVPRDGHLYRMNDPLTHLYAIQHGHFKTLHIDSSGVERIVGFQMAGELLGLDAIATRHQYCDCVALEDSEVCAIPFGRLESLFVDMPRLSHQFRRLMAQQIAHVQSRMQFLGNTRAEQRLADFLMNLSSRYELRDQPPFRFQLRMSREDIANYLGLTIETISRLLARFCECKWVHVDRRELEIIDPIALKRLADHKEIINMTTNPPTAPWLFKPQRTPSQVHAHH